MSDTTESGKPRGYFGVGVEGIAPIHSPMLGDVHVVGVCRARRAKLCYLRAATGKAARIKERKIQIARPV